MQPSFYDIIIIGVFINCITWLVSFAFSSTAWFGTSKFFIGTCIVGSYLIVNPCTERDLKFYFVCCANDLWPCERWIIKNLPDTNKRKRKIFEIWKIITRYVDSFVSVIVQTFISMEKILLIFNDVC